MTTYKPTEHSQDYWPADAKRATVPVCPYCGAATDFVLKGIEGKRLTYRRPA